MQREQDLIVRARRAIARWWPVRALSGHSLHIQTSAAHGGNKALLMVATVCVQILLGCGDERPPWSGFPIFPDAGDFELSPELASGLLAAQAAFAKQIAEQAAPDAGHVSSGTTGPITAGRATAGSEAPPHDRESDRDETEVNTPSMAANPAAPQPADTRRSMTRREDTQTDGGAAADSGKPQQQPAANSGEPTRPVDAGTAADTDTQQPAANSGEPAPSADSGTQPAPDAGPPPPTAGSTPGAGQPQQPTPTADAGTAPPTAGSAAPTTTEDAGTPTSDADGGN